MQNLTFQRFCDSIFNMKRYIIVLIVIVVLVTGYLIFPKYQIINDSGTIYKLNKITGTVDTIRYTTSTKPLKPLKKVNY